ncbi:MAG: hypothetical protein GXY53_09080 [Desulfobulbus sp.]|nr:hypothetical protein [Desulfobulbus sp.]
MRLLAPDRVVQQTYEAFKELLDFDGKSHELMADLEALYYENKPEDFARIRSRYRQFAAAVSGMITSLDRMQPGLAGPLREYYSKYDFYVTLLLAPPEQFLIPHFVLGHDGPVDAKLTGNKCHNLVALQHGLGIRIPEGFTISATTYDLLVAHNKLRPAIDLLLTGLDLDSPANLNRISHALMTLVQNMEIPNHISEAVLAEYDVLADNEWGSPLTVAVRSSALHEDGEHSFAGQYHSVLGVDRTGLLGAYLEVCASKYSPEALLYRIHAGISDEDAAMAVVVQRMIDGVTSGVVYTRDPIATERGELLVHAVSGLGLALVSGETVPDTYCFAAGSLTPTEDPEAVRKHCQPDEKGESDKGASLHCRSGGASSLRRDQAVRIAQVSRDIEHFFGVPQDIEWAIDGEDNLYILQARPLAVMEDQEKEEHPAVELPDITPVLTDARIASKGIAHGIVQHFQPGSEVEIMEQAILVTRHIPPSLARYIPRLAAVVCEQGSVTGHFATVCREFGVVLLVEAQGALSVLDERMEVTVDGTRGCVYPGMVAGLRTDLEKKKDLPDSSYRRKLRSMLDYIAPLHLLDPSSPEFRAQSCRSLHDIIRFSHEKAVQIMFGLGSMAGNTSARCRKLLTDVPLDIYLLDVGGAFDQEGREDIAPHELHSEPFVALWKGLSHPRVDWHNHMHFDWKGFSDTALSGGISVGVTKEYASYAIVSPDYLNLNMRFGFHFTLLDCLCGEVDRANYCQLRFAGGGGDYEGKVIRIVLLQRILEQLDFEVRVRGDLLDARVQTLAAPELLAVLTQVGYLLGKTKLLDMSMQTEDIEPFVQDFFNEMTNFLNQKKN